MKGGLKAVNARVDGLEWKMDGEFKAVHSENRPPARIVGFRGFSNAFLVKHCAVHRVHCASAGRSSARWVIGSGRAENFVRQEEKF